MWRGRPRPRALPASTQPTLFLCHAERSEAPRYVSLHISAGNTRGTAVSGVKFPFPSIPYVKLPRKAFIPWSQVKEISYRTGNRLTTVVGADGVKIYHAGFHADPEGFRREIKARTHLPLKIIEPGVIKPRITLD